MRLLLDKKIKNIGAVQIGHTPAKPKLAKAYAVWVKKKQYTWRLIITLANVHVDRFSKFFSLSDF